MRWNERQGLIPWTLAIAASIVIAIWFYRVIVIAIVLAIARAICMGIHIVAMIYDVLLPWSMMQSFTSGRWRLVFLAGRVCEKFEHRLIANRHKYSSRLARMTVTWIIHQFFFKHWQQRSMRLYLLVASPCKSWGLYALWSLWDLCGINKDQQGPIRIIMDWQGLTKINKYT